MNQPRFKVRITSNQIKSGVMQYVAQLTKTKPVITATPDSADDKDLRAAQMAEALLRVLVARVQHEVQATVGASSCLSWTGLLED
jgi:hypothetical protein